MKDFTKTRVTIANSSNKEQSFVPYAQSFVYKLKPYTAIDFPANSVSSIYYEKQTAGNIVAQAVGENDVRLVAGTYAGGTFTPSSTYAIVGGVIIGEIPYVAEAEYGLPAGNRMAIKITNPLVTKATLPEGIICKTETVGGYNEYTKDAFEEDGSLIYLASIDLLVKRIQIDWGDGFVTYTIDCRKATLASGEQPGPTPTTPLTPFEPDQTTYGYYLNGDLSVAEVNAILDQLDYTAVFHADGNLFDGCNYCRLVRFESDNEENGIGVFIITMPGMDHAIKVIAYGSEYDGPAYFSEEVPEFAPAGWLDEDIHGVTLVLSDQTKVVESIGSNANLWNGILCGANTEQPGPTPGLTPFTTETTQVITGIRFDTTALTAELENAITGTLLPNYEAMGCLYVDNNNVVNFTKIDDVVMFGTGTLFWVSGASQAMGIGAKGWYQVDISDPENPVITPIAGGVVNDTSVSGTVTYVGFQNDNEYKAGIDAAFAQLNGTVVGALVGGGE